MNDGCISVPYVQQKRETRAKLALVVRRTCDEPVLDSYSSGRSKVGDEVLKGAERLTSHKVGHPRSVLNQNRASERRTPLTLQTPVHQG